MILGYFVLRVGDFLQLFFDFFSLIRRQRRWSRKVRKVGGIIKIKRAKKKVEKFDDTRPKKLSAPSEIVFCAS